MFRSPPRSDGRCCIIFVVSLFAATAAAAPPNVLIMTADNLGYGDLKCYNPASEIATPHLNQLATQGVRLTSFYTASPTCTVSRACLLTGRIAQRHGLTRQLAGVLGNYSVGLNQSEVLLPAILKTAPTPYATGCFGKWNIGFAAGSRPTERGFDEFVGHASGNLDYYHHHYREQHDLYRGVEPLQREGDYATDIFADAAVEFIGRQSARGTPWFCYLPFNAPHFPVAGNKRPAQPNVWQAPDWAFAHYGWSPDEPDPRRRYAAVVFALDAACGRVLAALDRAGVAENTLLFFCSDNGAFRLDRPGIDVGSNDPLRHGGVTCWEGGLRVAAFARWPGKIPAGTVVDQPCWSPDLLVTAAKVAGADLPGDRTFDGRDIRQVLAGRGKSPHDSLFFQYKTHAAVRQGDWKIVREDPSHAWRLFHLHEDRSEANDLAATHPEKLQELAACFHHWLQRLP